MYHRRPLRLLRHYWGLSGPVGELLGPIGAGQFGVLGFEGSPVEGAGECMYFGKQKRHGSKREPCLMVVRVLRVAGFWGGGPSIS